MFFVERLLQPTAPGRFLNRVFHRFGHLVCIHDHLGVYISSRTPDRLNQRSLTAEKALFVGIENRYQGNFWQVQPFTQ